MFQVVYEYAEAWPADGPLRLDAPPITGEIKVSPDLARRHAKGYLTCDVAMALRPGEPMLVWGKYPVWRMPIYLHLRGFGQVAMLGSLDVDALTSEVIPLPAEQIATLQERANVIASRLTPEAAPTS